MSYPGSLSNNIPNATTIWSNITNNLHKYWKCLAIYQYFRHLEIANVAFTSKACSKHWDFCTACLRCRRFLAAFNFPISTFYTLSHPLSCTSECRFLFKFSVVSIEVIMCLTGGIQKANVPLEPRSGACLLYRYTPSPGRLIGGSGIFSSCLSFSSFVICLLFHSSLFIRICLRRAPAQFNVLVIPRFSPCTYHL